MSQRLDSLTLYSYPAPEMEAKWRDYLNRVECPAHYDTPEFFEEPYWAGKKPFAVLALEDGQVAGVLTGIHLPGEVVAGRISCSQVSVAKACDAVAVTEILAQGLRREGRAEPLVTAYTWDHAVPGDGFLAEGFRGRLCSGAVILDLSKGPEALFSELHKKRRNNIRYAIRNGVEVSEAKTEEDIRMFYKIYNTWRETPRKEIHGEELPYSLFEGWFRSNARNRKFFLARVSGRIIAGSTLRVCPGGLVEYANNSSLDEFLHLKPNDLISWKAIEWASGAGFRRYSLGAAERFHREFGGSVVPVVRYRIDQSFLRRHDLSEKLLDRGRGALKKLPPVVERQIRKALGKG
ncbi:MAG: GNAT family N-acetyltransferase [Terriglobia bacterium]